VPQPARGDFLIRRRAHGGPSHAQPWRPLELHTDRASARKRLVYHAQLWVSLAGQNAHYRPITRDMIALFQDGFQISHLEIQYRPPR
jgi:hypothetical protein